MTPTCTRAGVVSLLAFVLASLARPALADEGQKKERTDQYGDPLPPGALARLGTQRFRHGGGHINRLLLSRDGKVLVSKCYGLGLPNVNIWEFPSGKLLRQLPCVLEEHRAVALSPDDKTLAIGQNATTDRSATIFFYELATGREIRRLKCPFEEVRGLAFSPDGKYLSSGHIGQGILLWDLENGAVQARLPAKSRLTMLAFSPDSKILAAGDNLDRSIRLFDVVRRQERLQLNRPNDVQDFAFSPDGSMLVAGARDGAISLWNPATGKLIRELQSSSKYFGAVAWSPDGKTLAASEYDANTKSAFIRFWDPRTGKERRRTKGNIGQPENLAFSLDGKILISGGRDSIIRLWDVATGEERTRAAGHTSVYSLAVSPDGKSLAYGDTDIHLWDLADGRQLGALPGQDRATAVLSCVFSPNGQLLAGAQDPNTVNVWDVPQRRLVHRLAIDLEKRGRKWCSFSHVAFSPDGTILAAACDEFTPPRALFAGVRMWNPATGKDIRHLPLIEGVVGQCSAAGVAFAPEGRTLAASGQAEPAAGNMRVWDMGSDRELSALGAAINGSLAAGEQKPGVPVNSGVWPRAAFAPDGRLLAMNRADTGIAVWEAITGRERCRLDGHRGPALCVLFSPDGRTLASAGYDDQTIRLWDMETGKELRKLTGHRGKANALAFTPDGKMLISGGDDTTILFWDLAAVTRRERPEVRLTQHEWDRLWANLTGVDAGAAHHAIAQLTAARETVAALKERLHPAAKLDTERLERLLRDLDNDEFAVRDEATRAIEKLGEAAGPAIERALARADASPELRRRLERLQKQLAIPTGEHLRELRALEVLEHVATPEARELLRKLAAGAPEPRLTREAKAAQERLAKRLAVP